MAACDPSPAVPRRVLPDVRLETATAFADSLLTLAGSDSGAARLSDEDIHAIGYLERLRLGLGSPFRLIDQALQDGRLSDAMRAVVAAALLARAERGESYAAADATTLEPALTEAMGPSGGTALAQEHHDLISRTVRGGRDPRAGESIVRLAYALGVAEGIVPRSAFGAAVLLAALERDRTLSMADARRLREVAHAQAANPVALVAPWRATRRFAVERPPLEHLPGSPEPEVVARTRTLLERLRVLSRYAGEERPGSVAPSDALPGVVPATSPLIGRAASERWSQLLTRDAAPPQAPVVVSLLRVRATVLGARDGEGRAARDRLLRRARTEESLAAEHAAAVRRMGAHAGLARAMLQVAVALRAYGQEPVWTPASPSPSAAVLRRRHGLASIVFDDSIPTSWQPYYLSVLDGALVDMRRVLPALDVRGLRVQFGRTPMGDVALALHEPRARRLFLPPATMSGALAHELAHDLDWTASERNDYSTDESVRNGQQRLAAALARLTSDSLAVPGPENQYRVAHTQRPTEIFAFTFDWFIVASLGMISRSSGHLSAAQDDLLAGYVGVAAPDVTGESGAALMVLLQQITSVPAAVRAAFLERYGPWRPLRAYDQVRLVLGVPAPAPSEIALHRSSWTEGAAFPGRMARVAGIDPPHERSQDCDGGLAAAGALERARWAAAAMAASARAEGLLRQWAQSTASEPDAAALHLRALRGGPWDPDIRRRVAAAVRDTLLARASVAATQGSPLRRMVPPLRCTA